MTKEKPGALTGISFNVIRPTKPLERSLDRQVEDLADWEVRLLLPAAQHLINGDWDEDLRALYKAFGLSDPRGFEELVAKDPWTLKTFWQKVQSLWSPNEDRRWAEAYCVNVLLSFFELWKQVPDYPTNLPDMITIYHTAALGLGNCTGEETSQDRGDRVTILSTMNTFAEHLDSLLEEEAEEYALDVDAKFVQVGVA